MKIIINKVRCEVKANYGYSKDLLKAYLHDPNNLEDNLVLKYHNDLEDLRVSLEFNLNFKLKLNTSEFKHNGYVLIPEDKLVEFIDYCFKSENNLNIITDDLKKKYYLRFNLNELEKGKYKYKIEKVVKLC